MDQETIVIKIRDNDPLCVSVKRLTTDSRLFRYLICDLHFTELEMDDFHPDTVGIFLALLEDKIVDDIQEGHFRELHKMSVVFEVDWLMESCREWLVKKIHDIGSAVMEYEATLFLLEESRYILYKWQLSKFVDLLISKLAAKDSAAFIAQYMRDVDQLDSNQLDLMLKLGGCNTKVFLEIVLHNITGKQLLDTNTKYLLENMDLALCLEQNQQLYHQMFETLSAMTELTTTDFRFLLKLATESAMTTYSRKTRISTKTTIWNDKEWTDLETGCERLQDIILRVENHRINNIFVVVSLLLQVYTYNNPPMAEEVEVFIDRLENVCRDQPLRKAFSQHIDSIISFLKLSHREEKVQLIALLEKIKNNNILSSCHEYIILDIDYSKGIDVKRSTGRPVASLFPVEFKHPGMPSECGMSGKCGFVIKKSFDKDYYSKIELCKEKADYEDTELHYHDVVSAEDMHYLAIFSYTTQDGTKGRVYDLPYDGSWYGVSRWLQRWVPSSTSLNLKYDKRCIAYNISKHLVAKPLGSIQQVRTYDLSDLRRAVDFYNLVLPIL